MLSSGFEMVKKTRSSAEEYQKQQDAIYGELELMRSILKSARRAHAKN